MHEIDLRDRYKFLKSVTINFRSINKRLISHYVLSIYYFRDTKHNFTSFNRNIFLVSEGGLIDKMTVADSRHLLLSFLLCCPKSYRKKK